MKSVPDLFPKCICKQAKQKFPIKKKKKKPVFAETIIP